MDEGTKKQDIVFTKQQAPGFLARLVMNGLGLWIAARLSENIDYQENFWVIVVAAIIFSVANAILRPIIIILSLPAIILTLGLFMLVVNGFMVWLVSTLYSPFEVKTFGSSVLAAIIIWLVNYGLSIFFSRHVEVRYQRK